MTWQKPKRLQERFWADLTVCKRRFKSVMANRAV
jgi:hypothetical protein